MLRLGLERREAKMVDINSFAVLGGDKRQAALAESIAADGYTVYAWGFDRLDLSESVRKTDLAEAVSKCVNIVLPLPVTQDGVFLNAKYTDEKVRLDFFVEPCSLNLLPSEFQKLSVSMRLSIIKHFLEAVAEKFRF